MFNLFRKLVIVFLLMGFLCLASQAAADDQRFNIERYRPPVDKYGLATLDSSEMHAPFKFGANLHLHFINNPLEFNTPAGAIDLVGPQYKMDIGFAFAFCKYYEAGFDLPFAIYQDGNGLVSGMDPSTVALGDFRFHNKIRALSLEDFPVGLALVNTISFPSGDEESYFGDNGFGADFKLVLDGRAGPVLLVANFGYRIRDEVEVFDIIGPGGGVIFSQQVDDELIYGIGAKYDTPLDGFALMAEIQGATLAEDPFAQRFNNPLFFDIGASYQIPYGMHIAAGTEIGLNPGFGAGPVGFYVNFGWSWEKEDADSDKVADEDDRCPEQLEDIDGFEDEDGCPDPDNDKDLVPDVEDECPDQAEDADDYRDEDGCPEPDNDNDGIADADDRCPLAAEDFDGEDDADGCPDMDKDGDGVMDVVDKCLDKKEDMDGFEDSDGCPDLDNDKDGIPDLKDKCPLKPEDIDKYKDSDGCPDPDNDNDGISDVKDKCPNRAETINGVKDSDGCPEGRGGRTIRESVSVAEEDEDQFVRKGGKGRLTVRKKVNFISGQSLLKRDSFTTLNKVADYIKAHPEIGNVTIVTHTAGRGGKSKNLGLSKVRAKMIKTYLGNRGVKASRLSSKGMGDRKQLSSPKTLKGRRKNERVEFLTSR